MKNAARVDLGGKTNDITSTRISALSASIAIYQLPGVSASDVAQKVEAAMEELKRDFPEGLEYKVSYDTTRFVDAAIDEVFVTLFQDGGVGLFGCLFTFCKTGIRP